MSDVQSEKSGWGLWVWLIIIGLAAALAVAATMGWTNGAVIASLVVISAIASLVMKVLREHLSSGSRRQATVATVVVVVVFGVGLAVAWTFGRENHAVVALEAPAQRSVDEVRSECGPPDAEEVLDQGISHIRTTRAVARSEERGDFVAALVSGGAREVGGIREVLFIVLDCAEASWQQALSEPLPMGCGHDLLTTKLRTVETEEVVVLSSCGSGAYLDVTVVGEAEDLSIGTLYHRGMMFQGAAAQVDDHLLVTGGGRRAEIAWTGEDFEWLDVALPASEGVFVNFWWDAHGGGTDTVEVDVQPGETVYFRWDKGRSTDESVRSYRLLAGPRCQEGVECPLADELWHEQEALSLPIPGMVVHVAIVPNGYGEDAIGVTVRS